MSRIRSSTTQQAAKSENELELWTTRGAGGDAGALAFRVDAPSQYNNIWWEISDGAIVPVTSGAAINYTPTTPGARCVLKGVPISQITRLDGFSQNMVGDLTNFQIQTMRRMTSLHLYANQFTGDLSGWSIPASMTYLYLYANQFTISTTFAGMGAGMRDFRIQDNGMIAAHVDNVLWSIWNARAGFTYATPTLNVGGSNQPPTGNVVAPPGGGASNSDWNWNGATYEPLTGGAVIWDLAKDVNSEGFKKWAITYNGGSL